MTSTKELKAQLRAVLGCSLWLKSILPSQIISSEFTDQLIYALRIYGWELNRRIDGIPGTQDWLNLVALVSILAEVLKNELLESTPRLGDYRPNDEPTTVEGMTARLLSDAVTLFETSQNEMAGYLEKPVFPGLLNHFIGIDSQRGPKRPDSRLFADTLKDALPDAVED